MTSVHVVTRTMRAATLFGHRRLRLSSERMPSARAGEVLVRVEGCGVSASSLPVWDGGPRSAYPLAPGEPGHEGWGVAEALGPDVTTPEPGTRVAFLSRRAFAQWDVAAAGEVVPLPDSLDSVPFPGEAFGCALNVIRRCRIVPGDSVAVVGAGFLGLVVALLVAQSGALVTLYARRSSTRRLAESLGAIRAAAFDEALDEDYDCVIEAAGRQQTLDRAVRMTRVRGRLVIAGYHHDGPRTVDMQLWNRRGLDVVNAHERDPRTSAAGIWRAVAAVEEGILDPRPLVTHVFPLEQLDDAFEAARTRPDGFVKAVVTT